MWSLFLDDERYPAPIKPGWDKFNWKLARNVDDAMWYIRTYGLPDFMSLDHDLGVGKLSGMDFVKTFCGYLLAQGTTWPDDLGVYVHSQNPVGSENMRSYISNFRDQYSAA